MLDVGLKVFMEKIFLYKFVVFVDVKYFVHDTWVLSSYNKSQNPRKLGSGLGGSILN